MLGKLKSFGWGYILIAILLSLVGISFIAFGNMLETLAIIIGIVLIIFGIVFGVLTLTRDARGGIFALKVIFSVLAIVAGTVTAVLNDGAITVIADVLCLFLIVDGSFKLTTSISSKKYSVFGWWFMLMVSVSTILSAFIVTKLMTAEGDRAALTVVLGIIILIDAVGNLVSPFFMAGARAKEAMTTESLDEATLQNND